MPKTARVEGVPLGEFGTASPVGVVSGGAARSWDHMRDCDFFQNPDYRAETGLNSQSGWKVAHTSTNTGRIR